MTDKELEKAVELVNTFNRPGGKPLVQTVECVICGKRFASHPQDVGLARSRGRGRICPAAECQSEARRRRQRGVRADRDAVAQSLEIGQILTPSERAMDAAARGREG